MQSLRGLKIASGIALAVVVALSAGPARAADVEITPQARAHFRAGVNFLDDPDGARYGEAYREFKAAYALSPSWKIIGNVGLTAMKLERDGEAIAAYDQYLKEGGDAIDKDERAQVERDLQTMQAGVVTVVVDVDPAGAVLIDERFPDSGSNITNRYEQQGTHFELGLRAGRHSITARLDGYQDQTWTFETQGQRNFQHSFKLEKGAAPVTGGGPAAGGAGGAATTQASRPIPTSAWVVGGVSAAAAVVGGVFGVMASSKRSDYNALNTSQQTAEDHQTASQMRKDGQRLNLIADVCFGGAVVGAAVTIVLVATRPTQTEHVGASAAGGGHTRTASVPRPSLALVPVVGDRSAGAFLTGQF